MEISTSEDLENIKVELKQPTKLQNGLAVLASCLFGICSLLPWNCYITVTEWFKFKIGSVNSDLNSVFSSSLSVCSNLPLVIGFFLNTFFIYKYSRRLRVYIPLAGNFFLFLALLSFTFINTSTKTNSSIFFVCSLIIAALSNICTSLIQASFFGTLCYFPPIHIISYLTGQGIAGIFTSVLSIITISVNQSKDTTALIYFSCCEIVVILGFISYYFFYKSEIFKFYMSKSKETTVPDSNFKKLGIMETFKCYLVIFKKIWIPVSLIFLSFGITLMYFPGISLAIKSQDTTGDWGTKYFVSFHVFLMFNAVDTLSRMAPNYFTWPGGNSITTFCLCWGRLILIVPMLFCNKWDNSKIPGLLNRDFDAIIIMIVFAFTNGYFSTLAFQVTPTLLSNEEQELGGSLLGLTLGLGLVTGSFLSFGFNLIVA